VNHPELLSIPALMIADYLLTIAGAHLRRRAYGDHFKAQHYELNPIWQKSVERLRWFNPKHLALTALLSAILIACLEMLSSDDPMLQFYFGVLVGMYGTVIGRHLGNLAMFAYVSRHADAVDGEVTMSHDLVLWFSAFQLLAVLLPVAMIAAYSPQPALLGGLTGVVLVMLIHVAWIVRYRRAQRRNAGISATRVRTSGSATIE
jgi:hypothetical protein